MPVPSQTRAVSPVTLARHSARGRILRRVVSLGALGLFVAGMLVAAGLGDLVVTAVPVVAATVAAAGAAWLLWRVRPWRIARPAASALARATATLARVTATRVRATGSLAAGAVTAAPTALRAAAVWVRGFLERPREPWQPPAGAVRALERVRGSLSALILRTIPVRQKAHRSWHALATAGTMRALALAAGLQRRILRVAARRRDRPPAGV